MRKFKCIKSYESGEWLTEGKIYYLKDNGSFEYDDGWIDTSFNINTNVFDDIRLSSLLVEITADNKQEKEKDVKFKVGDVVKIIGNKNSNHGFNIGEIVTIDMICCRGEKGENCRAHNKNKQSYYVSYTDIKLINTSSSQSFTITVSDTITTLKSADKTVEIKRYHEDKHDVKVAIDNVVKKYFDEIEREELDSRVGDKLEQFLKDNEISIEVASEILTRRNIRKVAK